MEGYNSNFPLVSVIMGVYNDTKYLEEAIDSILNQTYTNFEFIICNDCSTDKKVQYILNNYRDKDFRIVLINNKTNLGLATSLNNCLSIARGKYIARMDSDDRSLPNRFEEQVNFLENNPQYVVCATGSYYIDKDGERFKSTKESVVRTIDFNDAVKKSPVMHPTTLILRDVLDKVDGYTVNKYTKRAEDYDLWCKLTHKGYKLANIPNLLFEYREDLEGLKKRRYKYRIQEAHLKFYWIYQTNMPIYYYYYSIRPLLVGLIPASLMKLLKKGNN